MATSRERIAVLESQLKFLREDVFEMKQTATSFRADVRGELQAIRADQIYANKTKRNKIVIGAAGGGASILVAAEIVRAFL